MKFDYINFKDTSENKRDNYVTPLESNQDTKVKMNPKQVNETTINELNTLNSNIDKNNVFENQIKLFLNNIRENIDELIIFINNNYKWNEKILRKYFLTKVWEDEYKLNYYNNQELINKLNAKILFWDYKSLIKWNRRYYKDLNTWDFKDKSWNKLLIYENDVISTSLLNISKDWLYINIDSHDKNFFMQYVWSKTIYLTINDKQYWEFIWDIKSNKYILQNHKDWNIALEIEIWKKYIITLNDKVLNSTYENLLSKELDKEEIKQLYSLFSKIYKNIEEIKEKIIIYLSKQIKLNNLSLNDNEYFYYIDKLTQTSFLINYNSWNLEIIWYDKISSWNPKRNNRKSKKRYFETPNLVINRNNLIPNSKRKMFEWDWRAEWTNSKWYWKEWSNIFNLWKYFIDKNWIAYIINNTNKDWTAYIIIKWKKRKVFPNFHLAMHKTTPRGTTKLWTKLSQWCIRSTPFSIDLLDSQWLLNWNKWKYIIIWNYNEV